MYSTPLPAQPVQLADDDPNDASDVGGGDGAQEDGALLLGCQAAQVAEKHANTSTKARSSRVQLDSNFDLGHLLGKHGRIRPKFFIGLHFLHSITFSPLRPSRLSQKTTKT